jgi:hypothetical protein
MEIDCEEIVKFNFPSTLATNDRIELPELCTDGSFAVYNAQGNCVYACNQRTIKWNGVDMKNEKVAEGIYQCVFTHDLVNKTWQVQVTR